MIIKYGFETVKVGKRKLITKLEKNILKSIITNFKQLDEFEYDEYLDLSGNWEKEFPFLGTDKINCEELFRFQSDDNYDYAIMIPNENEIKDSDCWVLLRKKIK